MHCDEKLLSAEAVTNLIKVLGMGVCERSDRVPEGKLSHTLNLSSVYRTGDEVRMLADCC